MRTVHAADERVPSLLAADPNTRLAPTTITPVRKAHLRIE
jgi:hypothetical protein